MDLYESTPGATLKGIAADLGVSRGSLKEWVDKLGSGTMTAGVAPVAPSRGRPESQTARIARLEAEITRVTALFTRRGYNLVSLVSAGLGIGGIAAVVVFWLRRGMDESLEESSIEAAREGKAKKSGSMYELFVHQWRPLLLCFLITMGGMIIGEEIIKMLWGPQTISLPLPEAMRGAFLLGDAAIEKFRIVALVAGLLVLGGMLWLLNRTKLGLLIRAGVEDREMVESLGYRIRHLFVGVFVAGSMLAGLGGVLWGMYQQSVVPQLGAQVNVLIFIVIMIGGLGSTVGCLIGALLVGLMANYTGFLMPKAALFSNIALMVAILLWRPQGVYPVTNR